MLDTNERIACAPQYANRTPNVPPSTESITLSVKSCRATRARPAPSASRTAISFCRAAARASISPATFAQAISKIMPTASIRTYKGSEYWLRCPTKPLCAGTSFISGLSAAVDNVFGSPAISDERGPGATPPCGACKMAGLFPADCGMGPKGASRRASARPCPVTGGDAAALPPAVAGAPSMTIWRGTPPPVGAPRRGPGGPATLPLWNSGTAPCSISLRNRPLTAACA